MRLWALRALHEIEKPRAGTDNLRSRRAIEKIGGVLIDRREIVNLHGRIIEHVVYAIPRPADKIPPE
jgi:hypothetical protein